MQNSYVGRVQSARRVNISLRDYVIINWPCERARIGIAEYEHGYFFTTMVLRGGQALRGKK